MNKIAVPFLLIAGLVSVGCSDDDDDIIVVDDADGDGIPDDIDDDDNTPPGVLQWNATITDNDPATTVTGSAVVQQVVGAQSFSATVTIRTDTPNAVRPWHVHFGTCASGGGIVGLDADYARLTVAGDGVAVSTARVGVGLDPLAAYHVNIHFSDAEFNRLIACGDLILQ